MFSLLQPSALSIFVTDAETLTMMWQTVVLGMVMIFAVLAILWMILSVFKVIFAGRTPKEAKVPEKKAEAQNAPEQPVATVPTVTQSNDELVAVLTAAVAAYMSEDETQVPDGSFRVVSFKRLGGGRAWNSK